MRQALWECHSIVVPNATSIAEWGRCVATATGNVLLVRDVERHSWPPVSFSKSDQHICASCSCFRFILATRRLTSANSSGMDLTVLVGALVNNARCLSYHARARIASHVCAGLLSSVLCVSNTTAVISVKRVCLYPCHIKYVTLPSHRTTKALLRSMGHANCTAPKT